MTDQKKSVADSAIRTVARAATEMRLAEASLQSAAVQLGVLPLPLRTGEKLEAHELPQLQRSLQDFRKWLESATKKLPEAEAAVDKLRALGDPAVPRYADLGAVLSAVSYAENSAAMMATNLDSLRGWLKATLEHRQERPMTEAQHEQAAASGSYRPQYLDASGLDAAKVRADVAAVVAKIAEANRLLPEIQKLLEGLPADDESAAN
jgi:hypothetical protein